MSQASSPENVDAKMFATAAALPMTAISPLLK